MRHRSGDGTRRIAAASAANESQEEFARSRVCRLRRRFRDHVCDETPWYLLAWSNLIWSTDSAVPGPLTAPESGTTNRHGWSVAMLRRAAQLGPIERILGPDRFHRDVGHFAVL